MTESPDTGTPTPPVPFWLLQTRDVLRWQYPELWKWSGSGEQAEARREAVRLDLLKSTEPVAADQEPRLYQAATAAATALQLDLPLTLCQSRQGGSLNVSVSAETDQAHLVLRGDLASQLNQEELIAVFGHELGHLRLWQIENGDLQVAGNLLIALTQDAAAAAVHRETLRRYSLYTEIFCDRCGMLAQGKFEPVVSALTRMETGSPSASVGDYLKQVHEFFENAADHPQPVSRPELDIRVRSLDLWRREPARCEPEIARMVHGPLSPGQMDLGDQQQARQLTRQLIDLVLTPEWMRREATLAHARLFFEDYRVQPRRVETVAEDIKGPGSGFLEYVSYLLLDFVTAERDLREPALAHTMRLAKSFGIRPRYIELARKELRLRKKQIRQIEEKADELMQAAREFRDGSRPSSAETENAGKDDQP